MAEVDIVKLVQELGSVQKAQEYLLGFQQALSDTKDKAVVSFQTVANAAKDSNKQMQDAVKNTAQITSNASASFFGGATVKNGLNEVKEGVMNVGNAADISAGMMINLTKSVLGLTASAVILANLPESKVFKGLADDAQKAGLYTSNLNEDIKGLIGSLNLEESEGGKKISALLQQSAKSAQEIREAEQGFIQKASGSGQLDSLGENFEEIQSKINKFSVEMLKSAAATGMDVSQTQALGNALLNVTGAMDQQISFAGAGAKQYNTLTAAIKTSVGTGQNLKDVFNDIGKRFEIFGEEGGKNVQNTLGTLSLMQQATNALRMPLSLIKQNSDAAAESFKYFGNNSDAAIRILNRMGPALKESGLGPKAIAEMTGSITQNIAQMGVAQRAFLSQSTGGAGGLMGAYEIELLKSQGKIDEVQKKMEESLKKQFGGKIVTLEEASKNQGAAAQYTKQVQLATTGPTKIVENEGQARALFEAMSKGMTAAIPDMSQDLALEKAIDRGSRFQERSANILQIMLNKQQEAISVIQQAGANEVRGFVGYGEGAGRKAQYIQNTMQDNNQLASNIKIMAPGGDIAQQAMQDTLSYVKELAGSIGTGKVSSMLGEGLGVMLSTDEESQTVTNSVKSILPNSRENVSNLIQTQNIKNKENNVVENNKSEATINIQTTCHDCQKILAQTTAAKVVDGKISLMKQADMEQIHTGHSSGQ